MKSYKNHKKTILLATGVLALGAFSSLFLVSCSNTKSPEILVASNFKIDDSTILKYNDAGNFIASSGNIDGFTSIPTPDEAKDETLKAYAKFSVSRVVYDWAYSFISNFQTFLATGFITENINVDNDPTIKQLAAALSASLGQGEETLRYGLQEISCTPDWSNIDTAIANKNKPVEGETIQPFAVNFKSIQLTFNWWYSDNGTDVYWKDSNFDPSTWLNDSPSWKIWEEKGITPPKAISISFTSDLSVSMTSNTKEVDGQKQYSGIISVNSDEGSYVGIGGITKADKEKAINYAKELNNINERGRGDVNNETYSSYYDQHKEVFKQILNLFSIIPA